MYNTISELFTAICNAVRTKEGSTGLINHQDIPDRVLALSGGSSLFVSPIYVDVAVEENPFVTVNQSDIIVEEETV